MNEQLRAIWDRLASPDRLRESLVVAATFVLSFETLRDALLERLRTFYAEGWDGNGAVLGERYSKKVLSLDRHPLKASIAWHLERGALNVQDACVIDEARRTRNLLAHEMFRWVLDEGLTDQLERELTGVFLVIHKVENWWLVNVEIPTNEQFDGVDFDPVEVISGRVMMLKMLFDVASGSKDYLSEFERRYGSRPHDES